MNIDYDAVTEILKKFISNEKVEILGISVGEERQVRDAIKNLLTAYEKEKENNKELRKYYATRKEVEELREINECLHDSAENYIHKDKIIAKVMEIKDRPIKDEFITATQGKLNTIIDIESLLDKEE